MNTRLRDKVIKISFDLIHLPAGTTNKHFSFLVNKNRIVSIGWNLACKTHPLAKKFGHYNSNIHSEISCVSRYPGKVSDIQNFTLVNTRVNSKGEVLMSKPCRHCMNMIYAFNITDVYYTNTLGVFTRLGE